MNMLKNGIKWLGDVQKKSTSETIMYQSGTHRRIIDAVVCSSEIIDDGENGTSHTIRAFDFIVAVTDLRDKPQPGDRITYARETYEVRRDSVGGGWRYADPYQHRYRIHTQIV